MPHSQIRSRCPESFLLLGAVILLCAAAPIAAVEKPKENCTVAQLTQKLATPGATDRKLADELAALQLSERLSTAELDALTPAMPGEESRRALTILADRSSFLAPPASDALTMPTPTADQAHQLLARVVAYVNTTLRQLPNFLVTKTTTRFEDRPQEDAVEATGIVSYSYQPLHFVGQSTAHLAMRDHREVVDETWKHSLEQSRLGEGMVTSGEFGSVLISVVSDALKGKITWARWEKSANGPLAVFAYEIPEAESNYHVQFCCVVNGFNSDGTPVKEVFNARSAYHGEIEFKPDDGSIRRVSLQAELPPASLVPDAGMIVEYGPAEIGGRSYICPQKSVSVIMAHTTHQGDTQSRSNYRGPLKTFLNEVVFGSYRRFGSDVRVIPSSN